MPAQILATLDGTNLPIQFRYTLPSPKLRYSIKKGVNSVRLQSAQNTIDADRVINWSCEAITLAEYNTLVTKFKMNSQLSFIGYWGDDYTIRMLDMSDGEVDSCNIQVSGMFQIVSVNSEPTTA